MNKSAYLLAGLIVTACVPAVQAQNIFGPQAHDWELTLGGGGSNSKDFDAGSFAVNASLGYYFTPAWEAVIRQGVSFSDFGESVWNGSTRLALDYNFDLDRFRPFVGVNFGGVYGESVRDTFAAGLETGVKYYVLPKTFVFGTLEYQWLFKSAKDVDNGFEDGQFVYAIGLGFNF